MTASRELTRIMVRLATRRVSVNEVVDVQLQRSIDSAGAASRLFEGVA
jgi:hypothetical protein